MFYLTRGLCGIAVALVCCACFTTPSQPTPTATESPRPTVQCSIAAWGCTSTYGAIARAPNNAWGLAYNHPSQAAANSAALGYCKQGDCSVVVEFRNSCGALATGTNRRAGWASAPSGDVAEALALAECYGR